MGCTKGPWSAFLSPLSPPPPLRGQEGSGVRNDVPGEAWGLPNVVEVGYFSNPLLFVKAGGGGTCEALFSKIRQV